MKLKCEDNGKGITPERLAVLGTMQMESETGTGIGLFNVNRRLMMTFGDQAALAIKSKEHEGTAISFRIPKMEVGCLMGTIRTLIVDDERYAREELTYLLGKFPGVQVVGEAESGEVGYFKSITASARCCFFRRRDAENEWNGSS